MPIINGQKVACWPCIRGHRSGTCNHADSRVMMAVRRPGRPLSACPHLPGAQCHCRWQSNNGNTSTAGGGSQRITGPAALTPDSLPDLIAPVHDQHAQNTLYYPQTLPSQVATDLALPTLADLGYLPPDQLASPYDINMSTFPYWHPLNSPESPHASLDMNYAQHHHPGHATDSYAPQQQDWWSSSSHEIGDAYSYDTVTGTGTGTGVFTDTGFPDDSRHDMSDDQEQHHGENEIRPGQNSGSTTTASQSARPNQ
ncbi:copper fist DNA binding domain-containing protein [Cladorrhinum sp. PSN259]|nr:copper fist DNA binding domain-containing protein [Cladorrhinum sp. PSN259]